MRNFPLAWLDKVSLSKTVDILLDRIYNKKLLATSLQRRTFKKLILDSCHKSAFGFNKSLYQQVDGVAMGSSLGPVLANIIMNELEEQLVTKLISDGTIEFYIPYADDTLVLRKRYDVNQVLNKLNSFHKIYGLLQILFLIIKYIF